MGREIWELHSEFIYGLEDYSNRWECSKLNKDSCMDWDLDNFDDQSLSGEMNGYFKEWFPQENWAKIKNKKMEVMQKCVKRHKSSP